MRKLFYFLTLISFWSVQTMAQNDSTFFANAETGSTSNPNVCDGWAQINIYGGTAPYQVMFNGQISSDTYYGQLCAGTYTFTVLDADSLATTTTFEILTGNGNQNDSTFYAYAETGQTSASGVCDGWAQLNIFGGTPPYQIVFNGQNSTYLNSLCEGYYTVNIYDNAQLSTTLTFLITAGNSGDTTNYNNEIFGCTDPASANYNPYATIDDNSCFYTNDSSGVIYGCMDSMALNFNPLATQYGNEVCVYDYYETDPIDTCFNTIIDSVYIGSWSLLDSNNVLMTWVIVSNGEVFEFESVNYEINQDGIFYFLISFYVNCSNNRSIEMKKYASKHEVDYQTMGISTAEKSSFAMYPNPANEQITIQMPKETAQAQVNIVNLSGQVVHSEALNSNNQTISVNHLSQGIYTVVISSSNANMVQKLVIE